MWYSFSSPTKGSIVRRNHLASTLDNELAILCEVILAYCIIRRIDKVTVIRQEVIGEVGTELLLSASRLEMVRENKSCFWCRSIYTFSVQIIFLV